MSLGKIVKRTFGNFFARLASGGTALTPVEFHLLERLVESLPDTLRVTVESQFEAYNLVQREVDGRALNFYRKRLGKVDVRGIPLLDMACEEAPLARLTAKIDGEGEPLHATLTAVAGRAFCIAFNRALPAEGAVAVIDVKQAWRSNFRVGKNA